MKNSHKSQRWRISLLIISIRPSNNNNIGKNSGITNIFLYSKQRILRMNCCHWKDDIYQILHWKIVELRNDYLCCNSNDKFWWDLKWELVQYEVNKDRPTWNRPASIHFFSFCSLDQTQLAVQVPPPNKKAIIPKTYHMTIPPFICSLMTSEEDETW